MNCNLGDLAIVIRALDGVSNIGLLLEVVGPDRLGRPEWWSARSVGAPGELVPLSQSERRYGKEFNVADSRLYPIRDNPGDESFVTEARKSLTITKQNDKLKKVVAQSAPLERAKPAEVEA